jgi:hypothetical protein
MAAMPTKRLLPFGDIGRARRLPSQNTLHLLCRPQAPGTNWRLSVGKQPVGHFPSPCSTGDPGRRRKWLRPYLCAAALSRTMRLLSTLTTLVVLAARL